MLKRKLLRIPVFNAIVVLAYADRESFSKRYNVSTDGFDGLCVTFDYVRSAPVLWADHTLEDSTIVGIISHECSHAMQGIFESIGQPHAEDNDEFFATGVQYLVTEMYKFYKQNKVKDEKHELGTAGSSRPISLETPS